MQNIQQARRFVGSKKRSGRAPRDWMWSAQISFLGKNPPHNEHWYLSPTRADSITFSLTISHFFFLSFFLRRFGLLALIGFGKDLKEGAGFWFDPNPRLWFSEIKWRNIGDTHYGCGRLSKYCTTSFVTVDFLALAFCRARSSFWRVGKEMYSRFLDGIRAVSHGSHF